MFNMLRIKILCCVFFLVIAQTAQSRFTTKNLPPTTASQKQVVARKARPVILASKQADAHTPVVDDSFVYWIGNESSSVMKVGKSGGKPVVLVSGQDVIRQIAVDETAVYFATRSKVVKVDKNGGAPLVLCSSDVSAEYVAIDKTNVYWFSDGPPGEPYNLVKVGKGGGTPVTLTSGPRVPVGIIADETGIYWYDYADDTLSKIDKDGGTPSIVAKFRGGHNVIAGDADSIYCANILGEVKRVSKSGGQPVVIVSGQGYINGMAVDQASIYFATEDRIKKINKAGGAPFTLISGQKLISGQNYYTIVIDAEAVYWANNRNGTVMKILK